MARGRHEEASSPAGPAPRPLSVAILGPGGVGGLLGALLGRRGDRVVCIARGEALDHLRTSGLEVRSGRFGTFTTRVEAALSLTSPVDALLITVKATSLLDALKAVPADVVGDGLVVPFLNGVDHLEVLRGLYPNATVVGATIRVEATRVTPGVIEHGSPFASIEIARTATVAGQQQVDAVADRLRGAGLDVVVRDSESAMMWNKLAFIGPLALLTTYSRQPIGPVREELRNLLLSCIHEVVEVANAEGADVSEPELVQFFDNMPPTLKSSMQRDQEAGRPMELEAIGGAVVNAAKRHGIDLPVTERLMTALRSRGGSVGTPSG